jgi:hypothetical protein
MIDVARDTDRRAWSTVSADRRHRGLASATSEPEEPDDQAGAAARAAAAVVFEGRTGPARQLVARGSRFSKIRAAASDPADIAACGPRFPSCTRWRAADCRVPRRTTGGAVRSRG